MTRPTARLTAIAIKAAAPGRLLDGGGMTPAEFRAARERLFSTQAAAAPWFGVRRETVVMWERSGPPKTVEILMRFYLATDPEDWPVPDAVVAIRA